MNKGYATQSKFKSNSPLHGAEENNVLPLQTINSEQNEEAIAATAATTNLLSPSNKD